MGIFKQPKVSQPEPIKVKDVEAEAQKKAAEEAEKLRKGRVKLYLLLVRESLRAILNEKQY